MPTACEHRVKGLLSRHKGETPTSFMVQLGVSFKKNLPSLISNSIKYSLSRFLLKEMPVSSKISTRMCRKKCKNHGCLKDELPFQVNLGGIPHPPVCFC